MITEFRMTRRVQFAETDMAGVLHFSNYFRLMEELEHAFWRSLGISVVLRDRQRHLSWPRVAVQCEYFAPARFEDELELVLALIRIGERSLEFEVGFLRQGVRLAAGRYTTACCDMSGDLFRTIEIPEDIRRLFEQHGAAQSGGPVPPRARDA